MERNNLTERLRYCQQQHDLAVKKIKQEKERLNMLKNLKKPCDELEKKKINKPLVLKPLRPVEEEPTLEIAINDTEFQMMDEYEDLSRSKLINLVKQMKI